MSTLRNTLQIAFADIDKKIAKKAVDRLQERSAILEKALRSEYVNFFDYMADAIKISAPNEDGGLPSTFTAPRSGAFTWKPLTERWAATKNKFDRGIKADTSMVDIYHGITRTLMRGVKRRKTHINGIRLGQLKKPKITQPFDEFIQGLADNTDLKRIEKIFGPLKTKYELIRPDGGKVEMKVTPAGIQSILQYLPKTPGVKKVPTTSLAGTRFRYTIRAFTTLKPSMREEAIVDQVSRQIKSPQWVKIVNRDHKIRALFAPLINLYLRKIFVEQSKKLLKDDPKRS